MKSSKLTKFLLAGGAVGAICTPGYAQDNPAEGADDSVIIVTANKRQENLQEVPAAISVISQEQLEVTGFSNITDISAIAPNLTVSEGTTSPTTTVVAIRGIASGSDDQLTLDPAVAVYVDGIYLGRTAATAIPMHDVEAVEVLRGPQGTLSGRNSTGGAVSFRLRRPTDDFGLDVEAGYGNQDHRQALVRLNSGNLFDGNVRMSFTYAHKQNDGYVDNILTAGDNKDPGYTNSDSFRFAVEADLGDTGSVYYSFDYADFDATPPPNQLVVTSPTVQRYLDNSTTVAGCNLTPTFARQGSLCLDDSLPTTTEIYGHVLRFENDFGGVTLRSTSGWRSWRNDVPLNDFDGLGPITGPSFSNATLFNGIQPAALLVPFVPAGFAPVISGLPVPTATTSLFSASNFRKQDQISQEIEILSNNDGPFTWVVGGFYFFEESEERNPQQIGFVLDVDSILRFNQNFGAAGPMLADGLPAGTQSRALDTQSQLTYRTTAESIAIYGQGTYRFGADEQAGVTLGLRYSKDSKKINQTAPFNNVDSTSFSEPTGHITFDYRFSDDVNAYVKAARGYRSGGFSVRSQQQPFEPEILWSYEAGLKTQFWDRRARFNVAGFYAEYSDQQVNQPVANPTGAGFGQVVVNAGKTQYKGIEADLFLEPINGFTLTGSLGYVHREFKEYPLTQPNGTVINIADQVIAETNTPDLTISGAVQYRHYFDNDMFLLTRVGASYEGSHFFFALPQTSTFTRQLESRAYTLVNAQIRLGDIPLGGDTKAFVQLWGNNIFDKTYETRAVDFGALGYGTFQFGRPATYGVTAGVSF